VGDAALAGGVFGRIQFVAVHVLLGVEELLRRRIGVTVPVRLRLGDRTTNFWVADRSELFAVADVFLGDEYAALGCERPDVILDLGAHVGSATLYFKHRFPDARVVAVEPNPRAVARLRRNTAGLPGVEILNVAVGGHTRPGRFLPAPHTSASRLASDGPLEVDVLGLGDLLERIGVSRVDLIKLDIEGAEFEVLESARLDNVDELIVELHAGHPGAPADTRLWLERVADRAGFTLVPGGDECVSVLRRPDAT
jgi:FkbM family methyltransferase